MPKLVITTDQLTEIAAHVAGGAPLEVCGFLGGKGETALAVYPVVNVAPDPTCGFLMDPQAQYRALMDIDKRGWEVAAIYHSHPPGGRGDPSPTDVRYASFYPGILHLIAVPSWGGQIASLRTFAIQGDSVQELPLLIVRAAAP
ncbi:MAG: hypothetical protein Kow00124_22670 [Anaerolineae bacterium]